MYQQLSSLTQNPQNLIFLVMSLEPFLRKYLNPYPQEQNLISALKFSIPRKWTLDLSAHKGLK